LFLLLLLLLWLLLWLLLLLQHSLARAAMCENNSVDIHVRRINAAPCSFELSLTCVG
jgi:hypothetical protein